MANQTIDYYPSYSHINCRFCEIVSEEVYASSEIYFLHPRNKNCLILTPVCVRCANKLSYIPNLSLFFVGV